MNAIGIHSKKEKRRQRHPLFSIPLLTGDMTPDGNSADQGSRKKRQLTPEGDFL
jgi:hypothetical protein